MSKEFSIELTPELLEQMGVSLEEPEESPLEPVEREQFVAFIHNSFKQGLRHLEAIQKKKRNLKAQMFNTETEESGVLSQLGELHALEQDVVWHEANGYRASFYLSDDGGFQVEYDLKERAGFKTPSNDERTT